MKETNHRIKITDSIIEGGLDFTELSEVTNKISIINSRIGILSKERKAYSIQAEGTVFDEGISFDRAIFDGNVIFRRVTFSQNIQFGETNFRDGASFREANFRGGAYFRYAAFGGRASFRGTIFDGQAYFRKATFSGEAYFREATFRDRAYFQYAAFDKLANFKDATFHDVLDLRFSKFSEQANFRNTIIKRVNFNNARSPIIQEGRMDFRKSMISEAHFQDIIFEKEADFSDVEFGEIEPPLAVVFKYITFEDDANFFRAKFHGDTAFHNLNFKEDTNFTEADFDGVRAFALSYVNFDNLVMRFRQLPQSKVWINNLDTRIRSFDEKKAGAKPESEAVERLESSSQALRGLEAKFRNQNQLSDANEAYYHMKTAELSEERAEKSFWQWFPKQLPWIVWGVTCGYGTRIYRIVVWCILFDLFFTAIYTIRGDLRRQTHPETKKEFVFKQRLFDFPEQYLTGKSSESVKSHPVDRFLNAFRFSSVVLLKIGYRDTTVSGQIAGIDYKSIVWVEWLIGFYLLASLAVTLSNTVPVVNRLITGVF
jgi:uncharacterized protein YjbI with pentapeptide repeats